mmetsp:Transcript_5422/g.15137  ORF Transcript_5422/g.15137 Transcript_5422/m.15137 type:complete len:262 (-) Transcript_5422:61-846(-)
MPKTPYAPLAPSLPPPRFTGLLIVGRPRLHLPLPSLPIWKPMRQSLSGSVAVTTTAPAPSPKRMHVPLSLQSTHLDKQSAPITTMFLAAPALMYCDAVTKAKTKPEQAAVMSKATAFVAPSSAATAVALPKRSSGEDVARIIMSMSSADMFAFSIAFFAAVAAIDASVSSGRSTWRVRMPVRWTIHSSFVSMISARSLLETTVSGAEDPVPMILTPATTLSLTASRAPRRRRLALAADVADAYNTLARPATRRAPRFHPAS